MVVLMAVCAAMMGAFLGYHLWLLRAGMTTNETFKWRDLRLALGEQLYGDADDSADAGGSAVTSTGGNGGSRRDRDSSREGGGRCGCLLREARACAMSHGPHSCESWRRPHVELMQLHCEVLPGPGCRC